uniref:Ribosomal L1 domain containing 1 n=1 Tax=Neovison vison TaxID=452646 RepID=A0A8C7BZX7_NEOVI
SEMEGSAATAPSSSTAASDSAPATPASVEQLDKGQIRKAVEALLTHSKSRKNANGLLLNENENFFLMVVLWKIPSKELRVRLWLREGRGRSSGLLFPFRRVVGSGRTVQTPELYFPLLSHPPSSRLPSFSLLPSLLSRHLPPLLSPSLIMYLCFSLTCLCCILKHKLLLFFKTFLSRAILRCSTIRVGHTGMEVEHVVENIITVAKRLSQKLPEKWESVKLLYVKTERSASLPIFSSFVSCQDEAKGISTPSQKKKEAKKKQKQKEYREKQKEKKKNKRLMKQAGKTPSGPEKEDVDTKTTGTAAPAPAPAPAPQKEGSGAREKKEGRRGKAQSKVKEESEDEIPVLVPIGGTPAKGNAEVPKQAAGKKSPKKSPAPSTPRGKKRKAFPGLETPKAVEPKTPGSDPEKKPRIKEDAEKEKNSSRGKKDPRQMTKKPGAKFFTTASKSAKKAPCTPKQWPQKPKAPQST